MIRPAGTAAPADWLLEVEWSRLVRFGPPSYAVHLRVAFRFDADDADQAVGECLRVLAAHTATASSCFAAVWEGWGPWPMPRAPRVAVPHREMLLFETDVVGLATAPGDVVGRPPGPPAHLGWPADRAWFLACDVDEDVEFSIGCSAAAALAVEAVLPRQTRRTSYAAPAPLWADDYWPLVAVTDHPRHRA